MRQRIRIELTDIAKNDALIHATELEVDGQEGIHSFMVLLNYFACPTNIQRAIFDVEIPQEPILVGG